LAKACFLGGKGNLDELSAQRLDLLLDIGAHVERFDDRAQTLGRGDRLQARDACAQHQQTRGFDGPGGGHQHRKEARVDVCRDQHRFVSADVGLTGEHIQTLRTGDPRRRFQGKRCQATGRHGFKASPVKGVKHANHRGARAHHAQLSRLRRPHFEDQIASQRLLGVGNLCTGVSIGLIGLCCRQASCGLDNQVMPARNQFFDGFRRGRDP